MRGSPSLQAWGSSCFLIPHCEMTAGSMREATGHSLRSSDDMYRDFGRDNDVLMKHKKSTNNFPARLHKLLSASGHDVIAWMVRGG